MRLWLRTRSTDRPQAIITDDTVPDGQIIVQATDGELLCIIEFAPTYKCIYGRDDLDAADTVLRVNPDYARRQIAMARWHGETVGSA